MISHTNVRGRGSAGRAVALSGLARLSPFQHAPTPPTPFVGRERESQRALAALERRGVVAITGIAGSGKTALAANVIATRKAESIWIEICTGLNDRVDPFLWQLAQPLAEAAPAIWRMLHRDQQVGWNYPATVRLRMILDAYIDLGYPLVIVVDRIEQVAETGLESLVVELCRSIADAGPAPLQIMICGRALPAAIEPYAIEPLAGLDVEALLLWAQRLVLPLSPAEAETIFRQTGGLPQPLAALFAAMLTHPERVKLERLAAQREIRRFAASLLGGLSREEQDLLATLATPARQTGLPLDTLPSLERLERYHLAASQPDALIQVHPLIASVLRYYQEH